MALREECTPRAAPGAPSKTTNGHVETPLLGSGVLILCGAFVPCLTFTSAVVSSLLLLSHGAARFLSLALDGWPADGLLVAELVEILHLPQFTVSRQSP